MYPALRYALCHHSLRQPLEAQDKSNKTLRHTHSNTKSVLSVFSFYQAQTLNLHFPQGSWIIILLVTGRGENVMKNVTDLSNH